MTTRLIDWDEGHYFLADHGGDPIDLPDEVWAKIDDAFARYREAQQLLLRADLERQKKERV